MFDHGELQHLISTYGYGVVALMVGLEGVGIPLPGETMLVAAALYAGSTQQLDIVGVTAVAIAGAVVGDNTGYWVGRLIGYRLLLRYRQVLRIGDTKIKLGQYLFRHHGTKVVFIARFVAVLRALAGLLAGANCMRWSAFLVADAAGAALWAIVYGFGAYFLGKEIHVVARPVALAFLAAAGIALFFAIRFLRGHQAALEEVAEREFPGPLGPPRQRAG